MSRTKTSVAQRPRLLKTLFNLRLEEVGPVLIAALFFFCILTALMLLRPVRDALGMERGIESVRWLFIGTALVTLAVNPLFGWLVSRLKRLQFIGATYTFFVLSLVAFWALLVFAPAAVGQRSGQVFFVWFSVFNLFVTMVFWALLADRFTSEQGKRFFALISVGGTLGAIFGPWLTSQLAPTAGFISEYERIGGSALAGLRAVFRSRYLTGIAGYILLMTVLATFIYFTRLQMVAAVSDSIDARAEILGNIDMWTLRPGCGAGDFTGGYRPWLYRVGDIRVVRGVNPSRGYYACASTWRHPTSKGGAIYGGRTRRQVQGQGLCRHLHLPCW
mgnify:CR=1 FL=1